MGGLVTGLIPLNSHKVKLNRTNPVSIAVLEIVLK